MGEYGTHDPMTMVQFHYPQPKVFFLKFNLRIKIYVILSYFLYMKSKEFNEYCQKHPDRVVIEESREYGWYREITLESGLKYRQYYDKLGVFLIDGW